MTIKRKAAHVYTPAPQPGFLGAGHEARPVIQLPFADSDPFIVLMDDRLDKKDDNPAGGPHPHAGFETVTLLLEGTLGEGPDAMTAGDFEMMTAGKGIIHTEVITKKEKFRLLQLWLNLPRDRRHTLPRVQRMKAASAPSHTVNGVTVNLYSGAFGGLTSPVQNHTPVIIARITLAPHAELSERIPANFNAFIYLISGRVKLGDKTADTDQVAWLDRFNGAELSELGIEAGEEGAQLVLYAGLPQQHEIVSHGPFIADSPEEIRQLYADFRSGRMGHIDNVTEKQKFAY